MKPPRLMFSVTMASESLMCLVQYDSSPSIRVMILGKRQQGQAEPTSSKLSVLLTLTNVSDTNSHGALQSHKPIQK